jgi:hypothetical protein
MAGLNESTTAVIVRGETWAGEFASEPYEAGWAREAVLYLRLLKRDEALGIATARVQISPDGMAWVDEGSELRLPADTEETTFVRIAHFGNWLRIAGHLPDGATCQALATLHLKA